MDLRLSFNLDPYSYDKFRPSYVQEMFEDIIEFSNLDEQKQALEIGVGTGQATMPFIKTGCKVTGVEIGDQLAKFTAKKFAHYDNFQIMVNEFENVVLDFETYDLVYSASAFHWIPEETGLPKVNSLLKKNGVFAWFSNQPAPALEHTSIHMEMQNVYEKHQSYFAGKTVLSDLNLWKQQSELKLENRIKTLKSYGFEDLKGKIYYSSRTFNSREYADLLSTYSDHKAMPEEIRIPFLKEIMKVIDSNGGSFSLVDIIILAMGKK